MDIRKKPILVKTIDSIYKQSFGHTIDVHYDDEQGRDVIIRIFRPLRGVNVAIVQSFCEACGFEMPVTNSEKMLYEMIRDRVKPDTPVVFHYKDKLYLNKKGEDRWTEYPVKFEKYDGVMIKTHE